MQNLAWGLGITVLGMGIVLGLLAILWGLLALVMRFDAPPPVATGEGSESRPADATSADGAAEGMDPDLVAAILVATLAHKAWRRQEAAPLMRSYWPGSLLYASRWVAAGRVRQTNSWRHRRG